MQFLIDVKERVGEFASENATTLLTAGGVVGTVATGVLTGKAAFKAADKIDLVRMNTLAEESGREVTDLVYSESRHFDLDSSTKIKLAAPYFIPPVLLGGATIASIIMAHRMSSAKVAALAAAYGLAERNLSEYKEKVAEKLTGPKRTQVDDELAQDRVNKTDGHQNIVIVEGEVLCFDQETARYFRSTMENLKKAVNATNAEILHHDHASAGFFYEEIGLPGTSWSDEVGWNTDNLVDLTYSTVLSPDGRPCIAISFKHAPRADYIPKHY